MTTAASRSTGTTRASKPSCYGGSRANRSRRGAVSAAFLIGYGVFRFAVELTREPDSHLGLLALGSTTGQWLSLPLILSELGVLLWAYRVHQFITGHSTRWRTVTPPVLTP